MRPGDAGSRVVMVPDAPGTQAADAGNIRSGRKRSVSASTTIAPSLLDNSAARALPAVN